MNKGMFVTLLVAAAFLGVAGSGGHYRLAGAASAATPCAIPPQCTGTIGTANGKLVKGTYSLNFSGGDAAQDSGYHLVGSGVVTSDGKGTLSNMVLNVNYAKEEVTLNLSGFYSINSNGLGFASLTITGCTGTPPLAFPGGQCGIDLDFTVSPNTMLFSANGGAPLTGVSTCFPGTYEPDCSDIATGAEDPFYGTAILQ